MSKIVETVSARYNPDSLAILILAWCRFLFGYLRRRHMVLLVGGIPTCLVRKYRQGCDELGPPPFPILVGWTTLVSSQLVPE